MIQRRLNHVESLTAGTDRLSVAEDRQWSDTRVYTKTRSVDMNKKADRAEYECTVSCRTESPKMSRQEQPWSRDYAADGYSRRGNFGGSIFRYV